MDTSIAPRPSGSDQFRRRLRSFAVLLVALATFLPLGALADQGPKAEGPADADVLPASKASEDSKASTPSSSTAAAAATAGDGLSEQTAAASCWEIVQNDPTAEDGAYWLVTPALGAPQQFYCDQTTDGGGWVLIGRGRENWTQTNTGRLSPADIAQTPTGTAAFSPAQLPAETVDGLLDDGRVDALSDGVRLRRAQSVDGTDWQEVRFRYGTSRADWSWQFAGLQTVTSWTIGAASGSGGNTGSFGSDNAYNRVDTAVGSGRGWSHGFSYGPNARGSSASTSYVWSSSATSGYPRPFTQVFLRPQLTSQDIFTAIPDAGLPASTQVAAAESYPLPTPWGVSGLGAAGSGELNTEVSDFVESEGIMYVGGNFRYVQRDANGAGRVEQSYLAAFDIETGEWISTFRPQLDNQVKALAVLPGGRLAVGGSFSTVAGTSSPAFTVLDPATGAPDPTVTTRIINYTGGVPPAVRSMDVAGGYLYLGGRFTHLTGSGVTSEVYQRNIGRLDAATLAPKAGWDPMLDGTVVSVDASEQGDRVYAAGYFGLSRWTEETLRAGVFTTDDATVIPWSVDFSNVSGGRVGYQQAVKEVGDRVWLGGSEHMLFSYDRATMEERSTNISQNGGDFQAINSYGDDKIAAGCHCSENIYQGARKWPGIAGFSRVEHIDQVGIWQSSDGSYVPEYSPQVSLRSGYGAWAIEEASDGSLWVGGDYTYARTPDTRNQWTGAFVRFAAADAEPPATPQGLTASSAEGTDRLSWDPVSDADYEVFRDDRVVATTTSTSLQLPTVEDGARYFVRAVDQASNRSATSPVTVPEAVTPGTSPTTVVASGGQWAYRFDNTAPDVEWKNPDFDDTSWQNGTAPLGWGHTDLGTPLTTDGTKPLATYYRHDFTLEDATQVTALELTTRADDGIVVYVNGTEVNRTNMPDGTITHGSYATAAPSAATALANPVSITVPGNLLTTGDNVITAEVHSNYRSTPTTSFDLEATTVPGEQPAPDPDPEPEPEPDQLLAAGGQWAYRFDNTAPDVEWKNPDFDDTSWQNGTAPLGWGHTDLGTPLTTDGTKPLATYYRHDFTLEDATQVTALELTTRADDGIVVYVNGTEVNRTNMPDGTITHGSYATAAPSAATALANPVSITVPGNLLTTGDNVITAEVHSNYRSTPTTSFDLEATTVPGEAEVLRTESTTEDPATERAPESSEAAEETVADLPEDEESEVPESRDEADADGTDAVDTDPDSTEAGSSDKDGDSEADAGADDTDPAASEEGSSGTDSEAGGADEEVSDDNSEVQPQTCTAAPATDDATADPEIEEQVDSSDADADAGGDSAADEVIPLGSEWALDCSSDLDEAEWTQPELDDSEWQRGIAPLGWDASTEQLGSVLSSEGDLPESVHYRHTVEIDDLRGVQSLELTLPGDADLTVWVNGDKVEDETRTDGDLDQPADDDGPTTLLVPADLLMEGENSVAVEISLDAATDSGSVFDARGELVREAG